MPTRLKTTPKAKRPPARRKAEKEFTPPPPTMMERVAAAIPNVILKSEPTLLDILAKEHSEATGLLDALLSTKSVNTRTTLLAKVTEALLPHLHGEEQVFYPLLQERRDAEVEANAIEGFVEHRLARTMLKELAAINDSGSAAWRAHCKVLKELVAHHIKDEEGSLWNDARKALGNDRLSALIEPYEKAKAEFKA